MNRCPACGWLYQGNLVPHHQDAAERQRLEATEAELVAYHDATQSITEAERIAEELAEVRWRLGIVRHAPTLYLCTGVVLPACETLEPQVRGRELMQGRQRELFEEA